jgi:hypothetical protein
MTSVQKKKIGSTASAQYWDRGLYTTTFGRVICKTTSGQRPLHNNIGTEASATIPLRQKPLHNSNIEKKPAYNNIRTVVGAKDNLEQRPLHNNKNRDGGLHKNNIGLCTFTETILG